MEGENKPVVDDVVGPVEVKEAKAAEPSPKEKLDALLLLQRTEGLTLKQTMEKNKLLKNFKKFERQRGQFQKMLNAWRNKDAKYQRRLSTSVKIARKEIGEQNFAMLKDLYTINVPEEKDANGQVTQTAQTVINYPGLVIESKHVVAMEREARIKAGMRKRSTGRSTKRKAHKGTIDFILKRNAEETIKQVQSTPE